MKFIVYFPIDKQIALVEKNDVMLGEKYEAYKAHDWGKLGSEEISVQVLYDNEVNYGIYTLALVGI